MNAQNLQSSACMRMLSVYIRNDRKEIKEEDLEKSLRTFQTDFEFLKEDIERLRTQQLNHEFFSVLHPWNYSLDAVDFKYILNNEF